MSVCVSYLLILKFIYDEVIVKSRINLLWKISLKNMKNINIEKKKKKRDC